VDDTPIRVVTIETVVITTMLVSGLDLRIGRTSHAGLNVALGFCYLFVFIYLVWTLLLVLFLKTGVLDRWTGHPFTVVCLVIGRLPVHLALFWALLFYIAPMAERSLANLDWHDAVSVWESQCPNIARLTVPETFVSFVLNHADTLKKGLEEYVASGGRSRLADLRGDPDDDPHPTTQDVHAHLQQEHVYSIDNGVVSYYTYFNVLGGFVHQKGGARLDIASIETVGMQHSFDNAYELPIEIEDDESKLHQDLSTKTLYGGNQGVPITAKFKTGDLATLIEDSIQEQHRQQIPELWFLHGDVALPARIALPQIGCENCFGYVDDDIKTDKMVFGIFLSKSCMTSSEQLIVARFPEVIEGHWVALFICVASLLVGSFVLVKEVVIDPG